MKSQWLFIGLGCTFLLQIVGQLTQSDIGLYIVDYLSLDSNTASVWTRPWKLITYALVHTSVYHFALSVVTLVYVHVIGSQRISAKLWYYFIIGALAGGLCFIGYSTWIGSTYSLLSGASAGVCGCISAVLFDSIIHRSGLQFRSAAIRLLPLLLLPAWDLIQYFEGDVDTLPAHMGGYLGGILLAAITHIRSAHYSTSTHDPEDLIMEKARTSGFASLSEGEREVIHKSDNSSGATSIISHRP